MSSQVERGDVGWLLAKIGNGWIFFSRVNGWNVVVAGVNTAKVYALALVT